MALLLLYVPVPEFQQPRLLGWAGERLCLSGWLQRVTKRIKAHSSPPEDWHLVPAGDKLQHREVQGD